MTSLGGCDHCGLQLDLLGGHLAAGGASSGPEGIFGGFLGGFELKHLLAGHGSRFGVRLSSAVPESYTICRHAQPYPVIFRNA